MVGKWLHTNAATPVTWGVAIDVPDLVPYLQFVKRKHRKTMSTLEFKGIIHIAASCLNLPPTWDC